MILHDWLPDFDPRRAKGHLCLIGGGSAPQQSAGSPQSAIADQTRSNVNTGVANAWLGNTNQITPYGNLTYTQTGSHMVGDQSVPSFTATQTLSPEQQKIYTGTTNLQDQAINQIAPGVLNNVQRSVSNPLSYDGTAPLPTDQTQLRNDAYSALTARSNQDLDRQQRMQGTQLANQGIAPGSQAYNDAFVPLDRARVDASNQATINAGNIAGQNLSQAESLRGAQIADITNLRNSPLQDYATLQGFGGGVTNPTYAQPTQASIAPTDVLGAYNAADQFNIQRYNTQQNQQNALLGGIFGLGGSILGGGARGFASR